MKTIKELNEEGLMSTRLYHALARGIWWHSRNEIRFESKQTVGGRTIKVRCRIASDEITLEQLLRIWTIEEIATWRLVGEKAIEELKGLI